MKAIVYHTYGSPDVLELKEVAKPTPKDNEVLVKVHAASVNSWDWDLLRGKPFLARLVGGGIFKPKYQILGADIAGRIEAVGRNVRQFQPGEEEFGDLSGCGWGGFGEDICGAENGGVVKAARNEFQGSTGVPSIGVPRPALLHEHRTIQHRHK